MSFTIKAFAYSDLCFIYSILGISIVSQINSSCSFVLFAGKNGFLVKISAKIHPTLHTSTAGEYWVSPSNSYGARYHRVAT